MAEQAKVVEAQVVDGNKKDTMMAIIAYFIFFIPLLTEAKNDEFVKFHVKQSIMLVLAGILVNVLGSVIPVLGWFLILPLGGIAVFVLWVMGVLSASKGETKELPLIGKYAKDFLKF